MIRKAIQKSLSFWWTGVARKNTSLCSVLGTVSHHSLHTLTFLLVTCGSYSNGHIRTEKTAQEEWHGWNHLLTEYSQQGMPRGAHISKESPAAHLCPAASGAQAQRNNTHGSMWTPAFSRTCHFRGKCKITPRNLQPFLSNTLLHSTDTTLLQKSSLSHSLFCNPLPCVLLISPFIRRSALTFSSPNPLMAFLTSFKMNASNSQQLEYVCIWQDLCSPPESSKNGAHFLGDEKD